MTIGIEMAMNSQFQTARIIDSLLKYFQKIQIIT